MTMMMIKLVMMRTDTPLGAARGDSNIGHIYPPLPLPLSSSQCVVTPQLHTIIR